MDNEEIILIKETEVERANKAILSRKAAGACGIPPDLLKYGVVEVTRELTRLFNKIMTKQRIPEDWKNSITAPLIKNKWSRLENPTQ